MKTATRHGLVAFTMLSSLSAFGASSMGGEASDEQAIRTLVEEFPASWNQPGMPGLEQLFTEDADFTVVSGKWLKGRDEIVSYHRNLLATFYKGSHITMNVMAIRFVRPDVAISHNESTGIYTEDGHERKRTSLSTWVYSKENGTWKVSAMHNTLTGGPGFAFGK